MSLEHIAVEILDEFGEEFPFAVEELLTKAVQAAARVNAHVHILAIAACCLAMIWRVQEASELLASIRKTVPSYRIEDFLAAVHLSPEAEALFRDGARRIGLG